jgi:hypothetical protein
MVGLHCVDGKVQRSFGYDLRGQPCLTHVFVAKLQCLAVTQYFLGIGAELSGGWVIW